jgi:hypothetical protein
MAAVVVPLRHFPVAVPVAAGALSYGAAALALRAVTINDMRQVVRYLLWRRTEVDLGASLTSPTEAPTAGPVS